MPVSTEVQTRQRMARAAVSYLSLGYSVIPIFGDHSDHPKRAAIPWKAYQSCRASSELAHDWFLDEQGGGIAIVTGRISRLVVLDFDDTDTEQLFCCRYPYLTQTKVVTSATRGLGHYYYHLPPQIRLMSRNLPGLDVLSDGRYVIAPPTAFKGSAYTIRRGGMPKQLTLADVQQLEQFFQELHVSPIPKQTGTFLASQTPVSQPKIVDLVVSENVPSAEVTVDQCDEISQSFRQGKNRLTSNDHISQMSFDLERIYRNRVSQVGRNNALFQVALLARDTGMVEVEVVAQLAGVHADMRGVNGVCSESEQMRWREAVRTIHSAYSRPVRVGRNAMELRVVGLPTALREKLLQQGYTALSRVLDAVILECGGLGGVVSASKLLRVLQGVVGRYSVRLALEQGVALGIFETHENIANRKDENQKQKCFLFGVTKPDKTQGGRPEKWLWIPDITEICAAFGVESLYSDPITRADVASVKRYRAAAQRELVRRRPGQYHRAWMARRLGVSKRTIQRYDAEAGIQSRPMTCQTRLTQGNLALIPDERQARYYLQDVQGKRYPAIASLAGQLLARGKHILLVEQQANYYWYGEATPSVIVQPQLEQVVTAQKQRKILDFVAASATEREIEFERVLARKSQKPPVHATLPQQGADKAKQQSTKLRRNVPGYKRYDAVIPPPKEADVTWVVNAVGAIAKDALGCLSPTSAKDLLVMYGAAQVRESVALMQQRRNIRNPAGFLVSVLRSQVHAG